MGGEIKRIFDILEFAIEKYENKDAVAGKKGGKWVKYSQQELIDYANWVSAALMAHGVKKGDRIINISDNRPEWNFLDFGTLQIGAVHTPVFPTISEVEMQHILEDADPAMIFVSSRFVGVKAHKLLAGKNIPIVSFDSAKENGIVIKFSDFIQKGKDTLDLEQLRNIKKSVSENDIASIIYTSGTTTLPKGVMLSHKNHVDNVMVAAASIGVDHTMRYLCYLPLSHSYERMVNYIAFIKGVPVYYNENLANIVANFSKVKPGIIVTVPLLLEKIYKGVINKEAELKGFSKFVYRFALRFALSGKNPAAMKGLDKFKLNIFTRLVYRKWKALMGGEVTKIIVGGASVSKPIYFFFRMIGIPVFEGYGMTEMSPLISYNNLLYSKPGTVGQPLPNVSVKISDDGEILTKGSSLMQGYYHQPELTKEAIDADGWMHTGDMGELDKEGFLSITGRKKDIFKTSSGTYVYPERIENQMKLSSFVEHVMVVGDNQDFLALLIVLNKEYTQTWADRNSISGDFKKIIKHQLLKDEMEKLIREYNVKARETHQIKKFQIIADEWNVEDGDLTPSLKIKRNNLTKKYRQVVESFYASRVR